MTAEIVLMNTSAVAMAADSAVTIGSGGAAGKVFNTATKVFTLSKYAPVGVMIYNAASFCGVPWETIIKDFRNTLGKKRFPTLLDYKNSFYDYIECNSRFFGEQAKKECFETCILQLLRKLFDDNMDSIKNNQTIKAVLDKEIERLEILEFLDGNDEASLRQFLNDNKELIDRLGMDFFEKAKIPFTNCLVRVRSFIALNYLKQVLFPSYSGVVITGFGEDDVFPSLYSITTSGFLFNKIRATDCKATEISRSNTSGILPYAQTQMMESVLLGSLPSHQMSMLKKFFQILITLPNEIIDSITELSPEDKARYKTARAAAGQKIISSSIESMNKLQIDRFLPMKNAISFMPKSELATVAEVFVVVAQLEHQLTLAAETVGGPIDVAVISKGDGFVWIKRKHYFDATLNPGFVENYYNRDYIRDES